MTFNAAVKDGDGRTLQHPPPRFPPICIFAKAFLYTVPEQQHSAPSEYHSCENVKSNYNISSLRLILVHFTDWQKILRFFGAVADGAARTSSRCAHRAVLSTVFLPQPPREKTAALTIRSSH